MRKLASSGGNFRFRHLAILFFILVFRLRRPGRPPAVAQRQVEQHLPPGEIELLLAAWSDKFHCHSCSLRSAELAFGMSLVLAETTIGGRRRAASRRVVQ